MAIRATYTTASGSTVTLREDGYWKCSGCRTETSRPWAALDSEILQAAQDHASWCRANQPVKR